MNSVNPIFPDGALRPIPLLFRGCVVFLCCSAANLSGQEHSGQGVAAAFVSGFERFARYDEISNTEAGSLLISELNCTACHANDDPWLQPKGGPRFEMEISVYEPIERWAEAIRSAQAEGTVSLAFSDVPAGTQVDLAVDIRFKGLFRLGTPIAKWILRREMQRDLANVVTCLATSAS